MTHFQPDYSAPLDDAGGPNFEVTTLHARKSRTSRIVPIPAITDDIYDDTFRLREAQMVPPSQDNGRFARGVPTDGKTSSVNYDKDYTKIIDGEHKTLLSLGRISEAFEADPHSQHILAHRLLLADPNLSETQRAGLLEHITDHEKKNRKKIKAVNEALNRGNRGDIIPKKGFRPGLGNVARPKKATQYDAIPQDADVDIERKRTGGDISMESADRRMARFDRAVKVSKYGRRGL